MEIEFLPYAYIEYQEAIEYYNLQSDGLGKRFVLEVDRVLAIVKKFPNSFSVYTKHSRRAVLSKFPYNLFYLLDDNKIVILAVAHQHRKPSYWSGRMPIKT